MPLQYCLAIVAALSLIYELTGGSERSSVSNGEMNTTQTLGEMRTTTTMFSVSTREMHMRLPSCLLEYADESIQDTHSINCERNLTELRSKINSSSITSWIMQSAQCHAASCFTLLTFRGYQTDRIQLLTTTVREENIYVLWSSPFKTSDYIWLFRFNICFVGDDFESITRTEWNVIRNFSIRGLGKAVTSPSCHPNNPSTICPPVGMFQSQTDTFVVLPANLSSGPQYTTLGQKWPLGGPETILPLVTLNLEQIVEQMQNDCDRSQGGLGGRTYTRHCRFVDCTNSSCTACESTVSQPVCAIKWSSSEENRSYDLRAYGGWERGGITACISGKDSVVSRRRRGVETRKVKHDCVEGETTGIVINELVITYCSSSVGFI